MFGSICNFITRNTSSPFKTVNMFFILILNELNH